MAALSIRDLDDDVRDRLRVRAARNGRSMEAEARTILTDAVTDPLPGEPRNVIEAFRLLAAKHGGVELDLPSRQSPARGVDFSDFELE